MNNLDADKSLFNGPSEVNTETSVRKSIESAATETMALAATTTAAANTAKMKEAASKVQHALMVRRNTELHNLDQLCQAATDRITELTAFQRTAMLAPQNQWVSSLVPKGTTIARYLW